jgi:hypothetical protein
VLQGGFLVQGCPLRSKGQIDLLETACSNSHIPRIVTGPHPFERAGTYIYPPPSQRNSSRVSTCLREVTIPAPNLLAVMMRQRYRGAFAVNSSGWSACGFQHSVLVRSTG